MLHTLVTYKLAGSNSVLKHLARFQVLPGLENTPEGKRSPIFAYFSVSERDGNQNQEINTVQSEIW